MRKHKFRLVEPDETAQPEVQFFGYTDSLWTDGDCKPYLSTYLLVRETPKGYWLRNEHFYGDEFWVSKTSRKRRAYPTKEEALNGYLHRKRRQVLILNGRLSAAKKRLICVANLFCNF